MKTSAHTNSDALGNGGRKILAPHTLILDYGNNRAALIAKE